MSSCRGQHWVPGSICQIQRQELVEAVRDCIAVTSALMRHNGSPQQLSGNSQHNLSPCHGHLHRRWATSAVLLNPCLHLRLLLPSTSPQADHHCHPDVMQSQLHDEQEHVSC